MATLKAVSGGGSECDDVEGGGCGGGGEGGEGEGSSGGSGV